MFTSDSEQNEQITDKANQLKEISKRIKNLEISPLYSFRVENNYLPVFGEGNINADIMFIGEAPGKQEAESGHPFVGRAGKLLDELLDSIGLSREEVYITNIVKDRPPRNRAPRISEINIYKPFLIEQIEVIKPQIIAPLGRIALRTILREFNLPFSESKISQLHGEKLKSTTSFGDVTIFPLYHPAAVFYNRSLHETLVRDFQILSLSIG